ncbi:MAG: hypothetical protein Q8R98_02830 [Rubrivivax sp.]|nr:hypothetical protein [Rubrivivax sp.]MDP3224472.1 hypothetical protein [Rubrivivax sp.]MDP3610765.1 hypothetical protein [Rubrivivax sp.]
MKKSGTDKKEAKKPKKVHVPNPPGLPASLTQKLPNALKQKR